MLVENLSDYIKIPIRGVIHIGAHHGQEKIWYDKENVQNIIWIDANPIHESILSQKVGGDKIIITGIGNISGKLKFNISSNEGQSSSFLEFGSHSNYHPDVRYIGDIMVEIKRMSDVILEHNIQINDYNFLNLDIQGMELDAIKSFDDSISKFDYIYTEVNTEQVYKNCNIIGEIDEYLSNYGFERTVTQITPWQWGDALYIKK